MSKTKKKEISKTESINKTLTTYFKGVKSEWGKVTWPEKAQVLSQSIVVIGIVIFFTLLVFSLDKVFQFILMFFGLI